MAEQSLNKLTDALFADGKPLSSSDFLQCVRFDDSIRRELHLFYSILQGGLCVVSDDKLRFQSWTESQIQAVCSIAQAIILASGSYSGEHPEAVIVATVQKSLEFALCFLEKSEYKGDDFSIQNNMLRLLEIALVNGTNKLHDSLPPCSENSFSDLQAIVSGNSTTIEYDNYIMCGHQGASCSGEEKQVDRLLMSLTAECMQPDQQLYGFRDRPFINDLRKLVSLSQHWVVAHLVGIRRLVMLSNELVVLPDNLEEKTTNANFCLRLTFGLRILKLLKDLCREISYVEYDASFVVAIASLADLIPSLFRIGFEFVNGSAADGSFDSVIMLLLEEYLGFVQVVFCNSYVYQNIQACILASILENLSSSIWRYRGSTIGMKLPLVYLPRSVLLILKLVNDVKRQTDLTMGFEEFDLHGHFPACKARSEMVPLQKKHSAKELMKVIFPSSSLWVDDLMHLLFFLHSEGIKLRPKVDRSLSNCGKSDDNAEQENAVCHEDEALFGDLFSESRSAVSVDGFDQQPITVNSSPNPCNMPIQAVTELLSFLKHYVFSPESDSSIFENACRRLSQNHIDILLSLLNCQFCFSEDKASGSCVTLRGERKFSHVHEICFGLLHKLLTSHSLSDPIEDYLVEKILKAENDNLVYNDQALTLVAYMLFCRLGLSGTQLRTKIYRKFTASVVEKVKAVFLKFASIQLILGKLPSIFHIEILLVAFHLSSDEEKAELAKLVFSSLKNMDAPSVHFSSVQLSCWGLLVSRLIIVLRHMVHHPYACPPSFLLDFRSKMREGSHHGFSHPNEVNDHLASCAATVVKNIIGTASETEPVISILINQLIDISEPPILLFRDDKSIECSWLNLDDACVTFSWILGLWNGKQPATIEDLIIERYIFILCWDFPKVKSLDLLLPLCSEPQNLDFSNMTYFFRFSHLIGHHCDVIENRPNFLAVVVALIHHLSSIHRSEILNEFHWDFMRNGLWLSLVLSLVNVGIWKYCMKNAVPGIVSLSMESTSRDNEYTTLAESIISLLVESGQVTTLIKDLSSMLSRYVMVYQRAFVETLDCRLNSKSCFSPLLLLNCSGFDKCPQNEILEKIGVTSSQLTLVHNLLSRLDNFTDKKSSGILSRAFWECNLHGFPSHLGISSGIFLSCSLIIRGIISVLDGIFRIMYGKENIIADTDVIHQIIDSVMTIKFDRTFESIHGKCENIYNTLTAGLEGSDYTVLFLLKHMETFIRDINGGGLSESSNFEWIIVKFVDILDGLRKDMCKPFIFQFYIGAEDVSEKVKELYLFKRGDLLVLIDSLDCCDSELVNLKVLGFFVDLMSGELCLELKKRIQNKFLGMDILTLSKLMEKRLLGFIEQDAGGVKCTKGTSVSLRESTMNFILCLVSPSSEPLTIKLQSHIFQAVLVSLDVAFLQFDINVSKSYFHFVVQLSRGETAMKLLLEKTLKMMEKLAGDENLFPGLKFLFSFLEMIFSDCGSGKNFPERSSNKPSSSITLGEGPGFSRQVGSRKPSDSLPLSANQEGRSTPLECDATSLDEDEDDGTSDGEVASLDKDEEEDTNSERALASKVCTFISSGSNFMEQHWYFCYTCDLTVSKGCCSVCAKVCHRGHRVVYSRSSRFFCDCGAGGVRGSSCQCLKPRKFSESNSAPVRGSSNFLNFLPFTEDGDQLPESDSDLDDDMNNDVDFVLRQSVPREFLDKIPVLLEELDVEGKVLQLCSSLLPFVTNRRDPNLSKEKKILLGKEKVLSYGLDLLQLKKAYKSGSLDLKIKAEYSNSKELKSHLASGSLVKSLLSVSNRGRLAVGEGDKVAIFDVGQLIGQATIAPVTADKTNVKPLSKNVVRFEIVHLAFNPAVENYLAVAGYEDCQVLTLNHRGEVMDRLAIELAVQGAFIRRIDWVPGSQVQLMVVTNRFVKIYDLSQDNISPMHYFTLPDDTIVDATLLLALQGKMFLIVLSEQGRLLKLELSVQGSVGATPLKEIIQIQDTEIKAKGSSLYFSTTYKLLFLSYQDNTSLIGRLSPDATSLTEISFLYEEEQDKKMRPCGLHRWKELLVGSGLFVCFSSAKSNSALAVSIGAHELFAQNLRHAGGSLSPLVGITAYKPLSKDKIHCLVLHDDGSLQIYSHIPVGVDVNNSVTAEKLKELGSGILSNKAYVGTNPEFPLDFFEKTVCITADVKLGGDAVRNGESESLKQSLASEDGFLEGTNPSGFKLSVSNSNPDIVMVGFRLHVGNTSANHIPSEITIFQRVIKLDEGMRSWYDIPFTVAESLVADEEFTISVGPTFNGSALPRIDSLEIYGRAKDEFGWKEKMDAVLDMEARALGSNSLLARSGKKHRTIQSAPIQQQVLADGLKVLSQYYSLRSSQGCAMVEDTKQDLGKLKCKQLLEVILESDREPLLQAAACSVLQAVFPKKDTYYQVKDAMRLLGVVKSTLALSLRLGGGTGGGWIIEEFMAQMRAVSKIALHRRINLATFLEMNGSQVIDGLMQVLWGILDHEQPDAQTLNNVVISSVELIYCYAECLALHGTDAESHSVATAVVLFKKLLFSHSTAVQASSSLAISSRLLQVPFPKQTMLATDDATENVLSTPAPANTTSTNPQVMIEEDSVTSSVQYCCDGCSTVPILRRRWHCTVCPDFDLCEACYEVIDADRLPLPHSRDHLMTAISIEMESLGADGNVYHHFSTEDTNDSNLLPATADVSMQNSTSPIHVLEPSYPGEFSASLNDPISISASKRKVNSLILSELIEQLQGWMNTSGVQAIPVMQLFYRLSSAVGGPFVDSSKSGNLDLEKLIQWFLDEINLEKPFVAKTRSSFGEVAILVFMFFTLMLRNWHQPGNESSVPKPSGSTDTHSKSSIQLLPSPAGVTSSSEDCTEKNDFAAQLLRACSSLRQQSFVNYLMDILQQLVHIFKSPANSNSDISHGLNPVSGCGALLTVRRDLPAGNFSPFFSDSYAKAHRTDIFVDYHRLLLENAFRLVYTLVRPEKQDKSAEKERFSKISGKDLKLEGYQDVLCSYINNPHTSFVRRYARRLFLHLCGSKSHYYSVRDSWQFSTEMKKLFKYVNKAGGFQNPMSYERTAKIVKCLSTMAEVAAARPRNWQKYCLRHGDVLPFMLRGIFYLGEESVTQTLKLLNLAFYSGKDIFHPVQKIEGRDTGINQNKASIQSFDSKKKRKGDEVAESTSEKSYLDMEAVVDVFMEKDCDMLRQFIDCFLLEWNSSSVRVEAKGVVYGLWHHGKQSYKETLLTSLLQKVKNLPMYGQNIVEYTELITCLLGRLPDANSKQQNSELVNRCLTPDVIKCIFDTLHSQNELLANHPNSRIYNTLSGLVEFEGYYLESEPCVACSSPEVPYGRTKLESLKSETKFTDNRIIVKCTGSYTIQSVSMNVHDARKTKAVKVLNLYYNNRPVSDLSELKNNWSLWKRARSCHLAFNQTELKVEFPIPVTACNFMIELDSFYENLQALSLEPLQCPRCSRPVTDKHGICSNCRENAYQCRQCRNINYENLDSFLCNECGYSKYGRFEFNFMAKPSFTFDNMENDEDMKRGLAAIESESENAHRRYQQLLGFKKPLLKIVSSIGENEMDSQQKDSVQQMMVSLPGPSCKINRKIALLGVLYGEKCKAAFDSVSKSVQTLQGLRRVLMTYLHQKHSDGVSASRFVISRSPSNCYGCAMTFVTQCLEILQVLSSLPHSKKQLVAMGILSELFENNIHQGPKTARIQARSVLCAFSDGNVNAVTELNNLIQKKVTYCLEHHRSMDIALATREELSVLSEVCSLADEFWESRLRIVFQLLFSSIRLGAKHPAISEHVILPCLRIISLACTPPKPDAVHKEHGAGKSAPNPQKKDENDSNAAGSFNGIASGSKVVQESQEKNWDASHKTRDIQLLSYSEWEKGASYIDFVRRQYKMSQIFKSSGQRSRAQRHDYLVLKYALRWKRRVSKTIRGDLSAFELGSWVTELVLSACSQSIRSEMCMLISLLCNQSTSKQYRLLNLLVSLLPATLAAGESAAEYFELLFKMVDSEDARLLLTVKGYLHTICRLITKEVGNVESLERSLHIDISQGFILHKLIELIGKFLEVPNIRSRFMRDNLLSEILEALIVIRGLIVQKTKLISDCNQLLKDLLDSLLLESSENKRQFIRACICGLQIHGEERKGRTSLFILEQLCNLICPSKPDPVYLLVLNKAHTQEEFIRGSMTKNPYSSAEIGPLMHDVKNKICHQLDLLGFIDADYGMELLVAGNIISLDLSISLVYEQVWKKSSQSSMAANNTLLSSNSVTSNRDSPPMTVTYRLQGLDGEATEPMIKELEEDREESQDPEVEFAIAGAVREYGGLEILLGMIQRLRDNFKSSQEQLVAVLNLLMNCCKIRENRRALLRLGALGVLLETARRAFSVDAMESAEGILLIVESLTLEANESDNISITQSALTITSEETGTGEQAKKIVLMFLERLSHPSGLKSNKQQRNTEMVARILPYLTYGEPAAMDALIQHFSPYLHDWGEFDRLQKQHQENPKDESVAQQAARQKFTLENFVRVSESLKTSSCGERLKDIVLEKDITGVAIRHLRDSFAGSGQAGFRSCAEWAFALKLPSVPLILSMLRGLSIGHLPTQRCIDEGGILPLLHALEGVPGENEIGARAENLLDTLSNKEGNGDGFLEDKVRELRHATRDEMRRLALRRREELLQGLGMRQELASDGGRIIVAKPILEGWEDVVEEEDGLACMVCREGYTLRPTDLLGVYSYSKRVNLGTSSSGSSRGDYVYTTVSYFNIIHFQCHQEAKRADAALRSPKKEWEGATLRNNESLCNSLFPVRGPSVPLPQYIRYVDQYWDNLNALGRADGGRLRLLTYDIVLMLARFATGASFSADCRGGGRESNSRFLPSMIQMARHLLDHGSSSTSHTMAKTVSNFLTFPPDSRHLTLGTQTSGPSDETVQFMMVNSLLSQSYESWCQNRRAFLQRGIYNAYMQHTHSRSATRTAPNLIAVPRIETVSGTKSPESETRITDDILTIIRPTLVYTGLIEQLQRFFKVKKSTTGSEGKSSVLEGEEDENRRLEGWEVVMKERLLNVREMVGLSKELLLWLENMNSADNLLEAFDEMGMLANVLSGGITKCEEFVQASINLGKSQGNEQQ